MTMPNLFTVALERKEREREANAKPDMVEVIADKLLEDHMDLIAENKALLAEREKLLKVMEAAADLSASHRLAMTISPEPN